MNRQDYHKKYYRKNRERILGKSKQWGKLNKERKNRQNRRLREENPVHYKKYYYSYRKRGTLYWRKNWRNLKPVSRHIHSSGYIVLCFSRGIKCFEHRWIMM